MRLRPILLVLFVLALAAGLAVGVYTLRGHMYAHEALPGVRVLGADLAGSGASEAVAKIERAAAPRLAAPVTIVAAGRRLSLVPGALLRVDSTATAAAALRASPPFGLQVITRWRTSRTYRSARSTAATLSGLSPERAKDTSSVGVPGSK